MPTWFFDTVILHLHIFRTDNMLLLNVKHLCQEMSYVITGRPLAASTVGISM